MDGTFPTYDSKLYIFHDFYFYVTLVDPKLPVLLILGDFKKVGGGRWEREGKRSG